MKTRTDWALAVLYVVVWVLCLCYAGHAQIAPDRARQIQQALRQQGYHLRVTGQMDSSTYAALRDIAKQNGWQTRAVPDARVLQRIGLGARPRHLLNPDSAWLKFRKPQVLSEPAAPETEEYPH